MGKAAKDNLISEKLNFYEFNQISPWTRDFLLATCTRQHNMLGDRSSWLTELLDGGTVLMDVWEIHGLSRYFA